MDIYRRMEAKSQEMNSFLPDLSDKLTQENEEEVEVEEEEEEVEEEELPEVPEVKERERVDTEQVFSRVAKSEIVDSTLPKVKKTKRVMSDLQKENLKKAREKAQENRKARKEAKENGGEPILTRKEQKDRAAIKKIAEKIPQTVNITNNISKEEIEEISNRATSKAILKYDEERKSRKQEKQKRVKKEQDQQKIQNTIRQATGRSYGSDGFYSDCF